MTTTTTMVATTYSFVDTIERSGMCNVRSEEHFNISDGGIERRGTRRAIYCRSIPTAVRRQTGLFINLEQSNIPAEETFRARSNLESRCLFFFFFSDDNERREEERRSERVLLAVC